MITANAQLENSNWVFGTQSGLNFPNINDNPTSLTGTAINATRGTATVSDTSGQLLLYTDGVTLFDRNGGIIADDILGFKGATQAAIFVPKPGSSNIYYLFTGSSWATGLNGNHYSEIDISLNGGLGDIVPGQKNIPLKNHLGIPITNSRSEKITSFTNCQIDFTWVVIQHENSYYAYKIDSNGVANLPIASPALASVFNYHGIGNMKISPNGEKIAVTFGSSLILGSLNQLHLSNFNINNGEITNGQIIYNPGHFPQTHQSVYGVEFSPDSSKLYFSTFQNLSQIQLKNTISTQERRPTKKSSLYQYDLTKKAAPLIELWSSTDNFNSACGLQRAINGKIYVATFSDSLGVINNPNQIGASSNYTHNSLQVSTSGFHQIDLPQWVYTNNFSDSWALNFGSTGSGSVRKIRDIETDSDGNIYVYGIKLVNQSTQLTALANGNDFTQGKSFIAKFNQCKQLIAFKSLGSYYQHTYGYLHLGNDNSLYIEGVSTDDTSGWSVHKILKSDLSTVWEKNIHANDYRGTTFFDPNNNNVFVKNVFGLSNSGCTGFYKIDNSTSSNLIESSYDLNLPPNISGYIAQAVSENNIIYISGKLSATSTTTYTFGGNTINLDTSPKHFIAKLTHNNGVYTPITIIEHPGNIGLNGISNLFYNSSSDLLTLSPNVRQVSNLQVNNLPFNYSSNTNSIITYTGNLNTVISTINFNGAISDMRYNGNDIYVALHSNQNTPVYLKKYNVNTGTLVWQSTETYGVNDFIISPQISIYDNKIYLSGLYHAETAIFQNGLPVSTGDTDLFALQVKDLGTTYGYRTTTNTTAIGAIQQENSYFTNPVKNEQVFTIFPNPFNNTVQISTDTTKNKIYTIHVADFVGTKKLSTTYNTLLQRKATLKTSQLTKGVYVLTITENGTVVHTRKLIK